MLSVVAIAAAAPSAAQTFEMKLAANAINDPVHRILDEFKTRIEARSQGRIKAQVFPASQLGTIPRMIEGTQLGTIELFTSAAGFFRAVSPGFQAIDAPGLFDSFEHANRSYNDPAFKDPYLKLGEPKGLIGIQIYPYGPTSYATKTPLRRIADFRGKKFRVLATRIESAIMEEFGATGVPIDFSEMIAAFQQGVIDGARSNIVVLGGVRFHAAAKAITTVNDTMIPTVTFVSAAFMNKLPPDLRTLVVDLGREMTDFALQTAKEFDSRAAQVWRDNGAEVVNLAPEEQAEFMRRVKAVGDEVLSKNPDPQTREMYALLKAAAERNRR